MAEKTATTGHSHQERADTAEASRKTARRGVIDARDQVPTPTELLLAWGRGDADAFDRLAPRVYRELHQLARGYMAHERRGHTLQATALVNEAYLRLIEVKRVQWQSRAHFLAMAGRIMRRILVDFARARGSTKRGSGAPRASLDEALTISIEANPDLVALDEAIQRLEARHPRQAQVVELRFFGGLTTEETGEALHVSPDTVKRDWRFAKLWLLRELRDTPR
jgi:RNA polymerase sigma factor (TIGR02999 family)